MTEFTDTQLEQVIAVITQLEADVNSTLESLRAAGFSEDEQVPPES